MDQDTTFLCCKHVEWSPQQEAWDWGNNFIEPEVPLLTIDAAQMSLLNFLRGLLINLIKLNKIVFCLFTSKENKIFIV